MFHVTRKWLLLAAPGSVLLASGCVDSAQFQTAISNSLSVFIASLINVFVQSTLGSTLGT